MSVHTKEPYTQVPHRLLEAMGRARLTATAFAVFAIVIRDTLGYHQAGWEITYGRLVDATGLSLSAVKRGVAELRDRNILSVAGQPGKKSYYEINQDPEQWKPPTRSGQGMGGRDLRSMAKAKSKSAIRIMTEDEEFDAIDEARRKWYEERGIPEF